MGIIQDNLINELSKKLPFLDNYDAKEVSEFILARDNRMTNIAFKQGYYCAVANLKRMHDTGIEKELLRAYGKINFDNIDDYDIEVLKLARGE